MMGIDDDQPVFERVTVTEMHLRDSHEVSERVIGLLSSEEMEELHSRRHLGVLWARHDHSHEA